MAVQHKTVLTAETEIVIYILLTLYLLSLIKYLSRKIQVEFRTSYCKNGGLFLLAKLSITLTLTCQRTSWIQK